MSASALTPHVSHQDSAQKSARDLIECYQVLVREPLSRHAPSSIRELDQQVSKVEGYLSQVGEQVEICFLGKAGVGKSTLINALATGDRELLPSGGVGTLTAQATRLTFAQQPTFTALYHTGNSSPAQIAANLVEGLKKKHKAKAKSAEAPETSDDLAVIEGAMSALLDSNDSNDGDDCLQKASLLIKGRKNGDATLAYLIDALQISLGKKPEHDSRLLPDDEVRVQGIKMAIQKARDKQSHGLRGSIADKSFIAALKDHAAGHLAPLVSELTVGWPSDMLKQGMSFVDLPGLGIAKDIYREVTKAHITESAEAVVLVVDRSGIDEASAALLKESGFFNRLIHSASDPDKDPVMLIIVATGLDNSAESAFKSDAQHADGGTPAKRLFEYLHDIRHAMAQQLRSDLGRHLRSIAGNYSGVGGEAGQQVAEHLIRSSIVLGISTDQYTRWLKKHPDLPCFIANPEQSGLPELSSSLGLAVQRHHQRMIRRALVAASDLHRRLDTQLKTVQSQLVVGKPDSLKELEDAFEVFIKPLARELENRRGSFREFLTNGMKETIAKVIESAGSAAKDDARKALAGLQKAHWATLTAAMRNHGTYSGATFIDIPGTVAQALEAQVSPRWSSDVLSLLQRRAKELGKDYVILTNKIVSWAKLQPRLADRLPVLEQIVRQIESDAEVFAEMGNESADVLRQELRKNLYKIILDPVQNACSEFLAQGKNQGTGVKVRVVGFFIELGPSCVQRALPPAKHKLEAAVEQVAHEISRRFAQYADPLEAARKAAFGTANEDRAAREAQQKQAAEIANLLTAVGRAVIPAPGAI